MHFDVEDHRITINMPRKDSLMQDISERFARGEGFALATVNLDHLVKLRNDRVFRAAYAAQDFVVADGSPLVWLSRLAGDPVALIPGADLVIPLARLAAERGVPVALVGSTDAALAGAAKALKQVEPGLEIAVCIAPPMGFDPTGPGAEPVFDALRESGARLVLLALGAPKQEILAARGRSETPEVGYASIGAGLDFLAGAQVRAPKVMRRFGLEWLWRLASNPRRLALRYARCAAILPGHAIRALRGELRP